MKDRALAAVRVARLADPELQFLNWLADKFAMDCVAEAKRLIAEIGEQEAKSEDNSWRLPNIKELIPNELPLPTIWPNEIQNPEPLIPGWQIPWGLPQ
ncbi:hypothetical protein [Rhizobium etli]|uniref:Uncharacterized protein n=1 Tax=Rhizobium etli TaxID=29449 RepID=A0A7W6ZI72_RHIET|nr:hypothetical protein [Rhizobium etli]MBB4480323.1 hypothetical protein [Rhizobium etli]MBB4536127.1 hypothetical protein [Rhizobium etli]